MHALTTRRLVGITAASVLVGALVLSVPLAAYATPPEITLGAAPGDITENQTATPFADAVVADDDASITAHIDYDDTRGTLSATDFTGTPSEVSDWLAGLVFTPAAGVYGDTEFTLTVDDSVDEDDASVTVTVTEISTLPLTEIRITANATAVFGSGTPALTPTISNNAGDLTTQPTCVYQGAAPVNPAVGSYPTVCSGAAAPPAFTIVYDAGALTVTPAAATVTASNASAQYGQPLPAISATFGGLQYGDTSIPGTTCASATLAVPTVASNCSGASSPNYTVSYVAGSVTVAPAALTITPSAGNSVYGSVATITPSFAGFVNSETKAVLTTQPTCSTTAVATTPVGGHPNTTSCAGAVAQNYTITYGASGTTTITPAALTITAIGQSRLVGQANLYESSQTGFVNGETLANLTGTLIFTTAATVSSGPGSYPIQPSGVASPNYSITFVPGVIKVTAVGPTPSPTPHRRQPKPPRPARAPRHHARHRPPPPSGPCRRHPDSIGCRLC